MRISSGKYRSGNLFAACPVHFLTSRTIGNVYICPVYSVVNFQISDHHYITSEDHQFYILTVCGDRKDSDGHYMWWQLW